jgi:hypothetical protein
MVSVPGFLLRRLYVKQSLANTEDGFQFELMNRLGSGYSHKVLPLTVDGAEIPIDSAEFDLEGKPTRFDQVTEQSTLTLAMNKAIVVRVTGTRLEPGAHKIGMGFDVPGLGTMRFDFTDIVADA